MIVLVFLGLLFLAGVAGAVLALRDAAIGGPVRIETRPELLPADLLVPSPETVRARR